MATIRLWEVARPAGRAACLRVQQGVQPLDGARVILPASAYITHPGGEIGDGDQLVVKPGEIGQVTQTQDTCLTFRAQGYVRA